MTGAVSSPRKRKIGDGVHKQKATTSSKQPVTEETNGVRPGHEHHDATGSTEVMTFYPSWTEFRDFPGYIRKIEQMGAHLKCGIAKIVPPPGWHPRPRKKNNYSNIDDYTIKEPVKETIEGHGGVYMKTNKVFRKEMCVKEFRKLANSAKFKNPKPELEGTELERHYWRSVLQGEPIYGADTEGTVYEEGVEEFNMNSMGTVLDEINGGDTKVKIGGVNTVYLYFGMWKTTFPWHAEDMDLYSINYLHFGAPKYWYAISSESSERFERLMSQQFPEAANGCKAFLRHKNFIVSPTILRNNNIPFGTMIQRANEFIVTFPKGYHMGFNTGYNCAESTNFASDRWIDFGKNALICKCRPDSVEIDMRPFMKKHRPSEYEQWENYWYGQRPAPSKCRVNGKGVGWNSGMSSAVSASSSSPTKQGRQCSSSDSHSLSTSETSPDSARSIQSSIVISGKRRQIKERRKKIGGKQLADLWASCPVNLFAERELNSRRSLEFPHCSVCQYFQPFNQIEVKPRIPTSSRRLLSSLCFSKDPLRVPPLPDPVEDRLLTCQHCLVTVHHNCYARIPCENPAEWRCLRCKDREDTLIRATTCHLCELRGGAYVRCKMGTEDCWVHVICALLNRRSSFDDPSTRYTVSHQPPPKQAFQGDSGVRLSSEYLSCLNSQHEIARFQCELCWNSRESLIQCSNCDPDNEPTLVHATCARYGKMYFERRDYPLGVVLVCDRHDQEVEDIDLSLPPVMAGDSVLVCINGGLSIDKGFVMQKFAKDFCVLDFLDGSESKNTPLTDIISCECMKCDGINHQKGSLVRVNWTDGKLYEAYFRRGIPSTEYWVRLVESASSQVLTLSRSDIYVEGERLPPQVRKILGKGSGNRGGKRK